MDDVDAITRIAAASRSAPCWTSSQYRALLSRPEEFGLRRIVLVAQCAGTIAGFAVVSALCSIMPPEAELENIATAPAHRQQGIGGALLSAAVAWARQQQAGCLRLEVRAGNGPALRLYARAGLQLSSTRRAYYADPLEDAICMQLTITS